MKIKGKQQRKKSSISVIKNKKKRETVVRRKTRLSWRSDSFTEELIRRCDSALGRPDEIKNQKSIEQKKPKDFGAGGGRGEFTTFVLLRLKHVFRVESQIQE